MKIQLNKIIALGITLLAFQGQSWTNTQEAASRLGASDYKEIAFEKNATALTPEQKTEIQNTISMAGQKGRIDEVKILVWADKEYPAEKGKLDKSDVRLAQERIKNIRTYLKKELRVSDVDTYNMTERPNVLQKFFNTSESQVKSTTESSGAAPTAENTGVFDLKAQASKAVVMVFLKK